ncbi:uncharacterized protein LOC144597063 [Rhinoraja longicauda]
MLKRNQRAVPPPWAALERHRAGERLRAALAGLQELELLRERQKELVKRELGSDPAPAPAPDPDPDHTGAEEQRLEATLSALKEQLSHLRRQDLGLKVHLQHLDRQISELKLDVSKASSEQLESDSRPSSGFYELSDAGSCSLSNSCTSMYSDSTSSSQGSLVHSGHAGQPKGSRPESRPRSADEITVQSAGFPQQGAGKRPGRGIKTTAEPVLHIHNGRQGFIRPRPVSTGDLERFVPQPREPAAGYELKGARTVDSDDWKYQCDLVSKDSGDVYNYPSPLHAVALQSPLFSLSGRILSVENKQSLSGTTLPAPEGKPSPLEARLACLNKQTEPVQCPVARVSVSAGPDAAVFEKELACPGEVMKDNRVNSKINGPHKKVSPLHWGDRRQSAGEGVAKAKLSRPQHTGNVNISASTSWLGGDSKAASSNWQCRPVAKGSLTSGYCAGLPTTCGAGFHSGLPMAHGAGSGSGLPTAHGAGSCLGLHMAYGAGSCSGLPTAHRAGSCSGLHSALRVGSCSGLPRAHGVGSGSGSGLPINCGAGSCSGLPTPHRAGSCSGLHSAHIAGSCSGLPRTHGVGSGSGLPIEYGAVSCSCLPRAHRASSGSSLPMACGAGSCLGLPMAHGAGSCTGLVDLSSGRQQTSRDHDSPSTNVLHRSSRDKSRGTGGTRVEGLPKDGFVQAHFVAPESRPRVQVWPDGGKAKVTKIKSKGGDTGQCGWRPQAGTVAEGSRGHGSSGLEPACQQRSESNYHLAGGGPEPCQDAGGRNPSKRRGCRGTLRLKAGRPHRARASGRRRGPGCRSDSEQSEYSAECASLSLSTLGGSSVDEVSDHTALRFADGESSGSELGPATERAGGSLLLGPRGLRPSQSPPDTARSRRSEARICRVKASRALKKKIRKFQPEALKVMTMV